MRHLIATARLAPFLLLGMPLTRHQPEPAPDPGGEGAPKGAPATPPAAGTPPTAAPPGQFQEGWLNDRLAQAKRSAEADLLKSLGFSDAEAAKKAVAKSKELEDAAKTDAQRKDDELKAANAKAGDADTYRTLLAARAETELKTLPEAAQVSIKLLAGDDPVKLLNAIDIARTMAAPTAPAAVTTTPVVVAKPPLTPAANTVGTAGGPASAPGSPVDHLAAWEDLKVKNPYAAAQYLMAHERAITDARTLKATT